MTLWSLAPWAVCFIKSLFSQCQVRINKHGYKILLIFVYNTMNSWTVLNALTFVILNESYCYELNVSLIFKAVHISLASWPSTTLIGINGSFVIDFGRNNTRPIKSARVVQLT